MNRWWVLITTLILLTGALRPSSAIAQPSDTTQRAVELGEQGLKLFGEGKWQQAQEKFEAAHELQPAPPFLLYIARCLRNANDLLAARKRYQSLLRSPLAPDAPVQFIRAKENAERELAELNARLPWLEIRLAGAGASTAQVWVDGRLISKSGTLRSIPLNPGRHTVRARSGKIVGRKKSELSKTVDLDPAGGVTPIRFDFAAGVSSTQNGNDRMPDQSSRGPLWPALLAFGIGAAGLTMGAITGGLASASVSDIESRCIDNHCPEADRDEADRALTMAHLSTTGFIVGGAGVVAGIVLVLLRPGGKTAPDTSGDTALLTGREPQPTAPVLQLRLAPNGVALRGVF